MTQTATKKEYAVLLKDSTFVAIGDNSYQDKTAYKEVTVEVAARKKGFVYFNLGGMFCRTQEKNLKF